MLWFLALFDHSQAADIDINITETITVSDSVDTLPSERINVSELISVNDAVTVDIFPVVQINVTESVGVSDSVGTQPSEWMEVPESVTVSDTVTVDIYPVVQIDISEVIDVSDSVDTLPSEMINVSELINVNDAVNIDIFPVVQINLSETVSVTESIIALPSIMINVSELVSVSDIVNANVSFSPIANAGDSYIGVEGMPIILDGSGSVDQDGTITLYEWDIDHDGAYEYSSSSPLQSHTYSYESIYIIRLRVTDDYGFTDEAITYAYIYDSSPTADFTSFPTSGTAPLTVNFYNYSDGYDQPLSYEWDFDNDGTVDSTLLNPSYEYPLGIFSVKLKVIDADGSTSTLLRTNYISSCLSPVRIYAIPPIYYTTVQSAYIGALDGETIQSRDQVFTENFNVNRNILVYFRGGFDCDYTNNGGVTVINGDIILSDGILIVESGAIEVQ
jgi:hypothetical protein